MGKKVKFAKSNYPFLKNLKLADEGLHKGNIDLLIGADFYWDIINGSVKTDNGVAPVALGSKLGWFLSGTVTKHNPSSLTTHVENIAMHIKTTNLEGRKIDNFWKLDLLGIQEKELSFCEKVMEDFKFENNRYVVNLCCIGPSLNDTLYKGPCLTPLLFDALLRFRLNPIGIIADIKQAYVQISVADSMEIFAL